MTNEVESTIKYFENRAKNCTLVKTREMYRLAISILRAQEKEPCEFCGQKPVFFDEEYLKDTSERLLVAGGWTCLLIGADEKGKIVLRACGDAYTDDLIIPYCPMCGRLLKGEDDG